MKGNTELQLEVGDNKDGTRFPHKFLDPLGESRCSSEAV